MVLVWAIAFILTLYFVVVVAGSWLLRLVATVAIVLATPVREIVRLYTGNQKRKARALLVSFSFAIAMFALLVCLLVAMP